MTSTSLRRLNGLTACGLCLALLAAAAPGAAQPKAAPSKDAAALKGTAPSKGTAPAPPPAATPLPATASPPQDEATALFQQAETARDAGKFEEAAALLRKAWGLRKTWDIAGNLGLMEKKLGLTVLAAEHLAFALASLPPTADDQREGIFKAFSTVRNEVAGVRVHVDVSGAEILVGGEAKGQSPLAMELFAKPGTLTIEAKKDGYEPAAQTITVEKGGTREVTFTLVPKQPPPPPRSLLPSAIAFGAGGAGLLVGAIAGGVSLTQYGDVTRACGGDTTCPESLRGDVDTGKTLGHVATAGFVIAGIGAAVGVTLLLLPAGKPAPARAGLIVGPGFVGVKGAF